MGRLRTLTMAAVATIVLALPTAGHAQDATVDVVDTAFEPATATVDAGGTVTWNVSGSLPHTITAEDGSFDEEPAQGETFQQTFDTPGTYAYYCRFHGAPGGVGMSGTIVVEAAATAEPTATETAEPAEPEAPAATGSISVSDQTGDGATVTVDSVTLEGTLAGWVVVHADADGAPGPVLGHTPIEEGTTTDLVVPFDSPLAEDQTVWPMLHIDVGTAGTYEFPGADGPVVVDGQVVVLPLDYTVEAAAADDTEAAPEAEELATTGIPVWALTGLALLVLGLGIAAVRWRRHA